MNMDGISETYHKETLYEELNNLRTLKAKETARNILKDLGECLVEWDTKRNSSVATFTKKKSGGLV